MYILESDSSLVGVLSPLETLVCDLIQNEGLTCVLSPEEAMVCDITVPSIPSSEVYPGELIVTPTTDDQTLETKHRYVTDDIVVKEIPTYEVSNDKGVSFIIAS